MRRYYQGTKVGNLEIIKEAYKHIQPSGYVVSYYEVKCKCGNKRILAQTGLSRKLKYPHSCGCYRASSLMPTLSRGHKLYKHPSYKCWYNMLSRCYRPQDIAYKFYGAKGIRVCKRWHTLANFIKDMGVRPEGLTLDRKNPNKDYSPSNCKWSTVTEQNRNRRHHIRLNVEGMVMTRHQACTRYGLADTTLVYYAKSRGLSEQEAFQEIVLEKGLRPLI